MKVEADERKIVKGDGARWEEHGVTERRSHTGFQLKWLVTVYLSGQRLPWVRVRSDAWILDVELGKHSNHRLIWTVCLLHKKKTDHPHWYLRHLWFKRLKFDQEASWKSCSASQRAVTDSSLLAAWWTRVACASIVSTKCLLHELSWPVILCEFDSFPTPIPVKLECCVK